MGAEDMDEVGWTGKLIRGAGADDVGVLAGLTGLTGRFNFHEHLLEK